MRTTNPGDPNDKIAIQIGNLFIDCNKKMKSDLSNELDKIREQEKSEAFEGILLSKISYIA